ncbi:MAG: leucyl aminopeptidase [Polaribacter sp.]|jgi:leucyl aminopeptidase
MKLQYKTSPDQKTKITLLPYFDNDVDYNYIKSITGVNVGNEFQGKRRSSLLVYSKTNNNKYYLLGLGDPKKQTRQSSDTFRHLAFNQSESWPTTVAIDLRHLSTEMAYHAALGICLSSYLPDDLKTEKKGLNANLKKMNLQIIHSDTSAKVWAKEGQLTGETQMAMMHLVNSPANVKTPKYLAAYAKKSGKANGFKVDILQEAELKKQGLHALLAVGQGSKHDSVLIKMEYKPAGKKKSKRPQLGLVGKGITFDTGGISIKGANNMHYMKSDMGGAAAVMGAIELAAKLKLNIHIVALIPSAENAVDANSILPGDVIKSYSGKTIEIIDTDAEGRLILADGLNYIQKNYNPETVLDFATLTGSIVRSLGYTAAGLFTTNERLSNALQLAGTDTHERVWPFPMWDDYDHDISSDVADVRNFSGRAVAGAISAAKFLEYFIPDHPSWAHLDIAGVAFGNSDYTKMKSANAYGVRLLIAFMRGMI